PGALDGFGLAAWAKSVRPDLKVLYTSGYSWAAAQAHAGSVHGAMLRKPYRAGELQRAVQSALARRADDAEGDDGAARSAPRSAPRTAPGPPPDRPLIGSGSTLRATRDRCEKSLYSGAKRDF